MRRSKYSISNTTWRASKAAYHQADKAFTHAAKWVATDHTGFSRAMDEMPKMGFIDSCKYIAIHFIMAMLGALISAVLMFILMAFGIPLFIKFLLT